MSLDLLSPTEYSWVWRLKHLSNQINQTLPQQRLYQKKKKSFWEQIRNGYVVECIYFYTRKCFRGKISNIQFR